MKRVFLLCTLIAGISFTQEKNAKIFAAQSDKDLKVTSVFLSSDRIHEMMSNREIAPSVAWMILWANFPQDIQTILAHK